MSVLQIIWTITCILVLSIAFTIIYIIILKKIANKMNDESIFPIDNNKKSQKEQPQKRIVKTTEDCKEERLFGEFGEFIDEIVKDIND